MSSYLFVYGTVSSQELAQKIAKRLVEEDLCACVNLLPGMLSFYKWQGALEEGHETVLIAKSKEALFPALSERFAALSGYDCPCLVALPFEKGWPPYLAWLDKTLS